MYAAVATSAPVRAETGEQSFYFSPPCFLLITILLLLSDMFQYMEQTGESVSQVVGPACDAAIRSATTLIESMLATSAGAGKLSALFNTCTPLKSLQAGDWKLSAMFESALMSGWQGTVQYNRRR